ncbi:hypothetical protein [Micromonospora vulcania]|uniref:Uncharacterized protein n=1 Tax=Micromonospora vulcania TaxID=1441873 RepID=A0ABW1HHZ6_9ACTN
MDALIGRRLVKVVRLAWRRSDEPVELSVGPVQLVFADGRALLLDGQSDWTVALTETCPGDAQYKASGPDPLLAEVCALVQRGDRMAALRYVREQAPRMSLRNAKAYIDAVSKGDEPSECLTGFTREEPEPLPLAIETLAGPYDEDAGA